MKKLLNAILVLAMICGQSTMLKAKSNVTCSELTSTNADAQNYTLWSSPIYSYLEKTDEGWMRVLVDDGVKGYVVDYFDESFKETNRITVKEQLPIFGGFYASKKHYYIVSGQDNTNESNTKEVVRVSKYDKQWNYIKSTAISNINTTIPFDAGSLRMDDDGTYLLIRTAHEMYKSEDGYNHQSNMTFQIKMSTMTLTDSYTEVMNNNYGYVSHSFNQFIKLENNSLITLDHGDAHPRSFVLMKYNTDYTDGTFSKSYSEKIDIVNILSFAGSNGANYTGATVGGLEISDTHYLMVGNSVPQDKNLYNYDTANIFVGVVNKSTLKSEVLYKTNYAEGDADVSTPQLVKVNDNKFVVLYEVNGKVNYLIIDGSGKTIQNVKTIDGSLSDCQPVVYNNTLTWYVYNRNVTTFYQLNTNTNKFSQTIVNTGHQFEVHGTQKDGYLNATCKKCDKDATISCIQYLNLYWNETGSGTFYSYFDNQIDVGDSLYYLTNIYYPTDKDYDFVDDLEIIVQNPDVLKFDGSEIFGSFTGLKAGISKVTFTSKYNPDVKQVVYLKVGDYKDAMKSMKISNLKIKALDYKKLSLTWNAADNASAYEIYRRNETGKYELVHTTKNTKYQPTVKTGVTYDYYVLPICNADGERISGTRSVAVQAATSLTGDLKITISKVSNNKIKLTWNKIEGATRYVIYRKNGNASYKKVLTLSGDKTSYTSGILKPQTYGYKIKPARYDSSQRVYGNVSNEVSVNITLSKPVISLSKKTSKSVSIAWDKVDAASYYQVYRKTGNGTYQKIKTTSKTSYIDTGLKNKTYTYKVRAYTVVNDKNVYSSYSSEKTIDMN